jgi:hypothetical protein
VAASLSWASKFVACGEVSSAFRPESSLQNYDFVAEKVGDGPFVGLTSHSAGFDDEAGVFRIFDVWETREHAERFLAEKVQPLVEQGPQAFLNPDKLRSTDQGRLLRTAPRGGITNDGKPSAEA